MNKLLILLLVTNLAWADCKHSLSVCQNDSNEVKQENVVLKQQLEEQKKDSDEAMPAVVAFIWGMAAGGLFFALMRNGK